MRPRPRYGAPGYLGSGKLIDRVALVTGGESGVGRAVAVLFAREGADVAVVYLPTEQHDAEETGWRVRAEGRRCLLIPGDLADPAFCTNAVELTVGRLGRLDILVNNAASQRHQPTIADLTDEQLEYSFQVNVFAAVHLTRAAIPHLAPGSSIINTGSIVGQVGSGGLLDYAATKGAMHAFTKSLAQNLVERGIRVNCVAPGPVWTALNVADKDPADVSEHGADALLRRPAQPEEVAPAFVFFASPVDSSYVTGEVLSLLGGATTAG